MTPMVFTDGKKRKTLTKKDHAYRKWYERTSFPKVNATGSSEISRICDGVAFVALISL